MKSKRLVLVVAVVVALALAVAAPALAAWYQTRITLCASTFTYGADQLPIGDTVIANYVRSVSFAFVALTADGAFNADNFMLVRDFITSRPIGNDLELRLNSAGTLYFHNTGSGPANVGLEGVVLNQYGSCPW